MALQKAYIGYLVGDGQKLLTDIDYAPLPKSIQDKADGATGQDHR